MKNDKSPGNDAMAKFLQILLEFLLEGSGRFPCGTMASKLANSQQVSLKARYHDLSKGPKYKKILKKQPVNQSQC